MMLPAVSRAQTMTVTKTITWTYNAAPAAKETNTYTWFLGASAFQRGFAQANQTNPANGKPGSATWAANAALPAANEAVGPVTSGAASATGSATFSATAPAAAGALWNSTSTYLLTDTVATPANSMTNVKNGGTFTMETGLATGAVITVAGNKNIMTNPKAVGKASSSGNLNTAAGGWTDPMSISLIDATTSTTVASQEIGALNGSYNLNGSFEWDSTGITLTAPLDGQSSSSVSADIGDTNGTGTYSGSWVTDSDTGLSTASLANGVFTTTGIFAGLPWVANSPTDPTTESLSPAYLSSLTIDYSEPSSLVNGTDMYYEQLTSSDEIDLSETNGSVPEPAAISMLSSLGLLALRRRRSTRSS